MKYKQPRNYIMPEQIADVYFNRLTLPHNRHNSVKRIIDKYLSNQVVGKRYATYAKLEKGQQMVNEAIVEIAEMEASRRAEQKIINPKKKYEDELAKMQAVLIEAQDSSVIGLLRKKFNGNQL